MGERGSSSKGGAPLHPNLGPRWGPSGELLEGLLVRKLRRINESDDGYEPGGRRFESCRARQPSLARIQPELQLAGHPPPLARDSKRATARWLIPQRAEVRQETDERRRAGRANVFSINERHVAAVLRKWVTHYNRGRPHASLGPESRTGRRMTRSARGSK